MPSRPNPAPRGARKTLVAFALLLGLARPASPDPAPSTVVRDLILRGDARAAQAEARRRLDLLPAGPGAERARLLGLLVKASQGAGEGFLPETRAIADSAVSMSEAVHGPEHPAVGLALARQASVVYEWTDAPSALPIIERAVALIDRGRGVRPGDLAEVLTLYANVVSDMGDLPGATSAFDRSRRVIGTMPAGLEREVRSLECTNGLAIHRIHRENQRLAARELLEPALRAAARALGETHPLVLRAQFWLSLTMAMPERQMRIDLQRRVAGELERVLGPRHPELVEVLTQLGVTLWRSGHTEQADSVLKRTIEVAESIPGGGRSLLGFACNMRGNVLEVLDRPAEAKQCLVRALAIYRETSPDNSEVMAFIHNDLGNIENALGDLVAAQAMYDRAVAWSEGSANVPPIYFGLNLSNAGNVRNRLGDTAGARRLLERSIATFDSTPNAPKNWKARAHMVLGDVLAGAGEPDASLKYRERAIEIARTYYAPHDPELASMEATLAIGYASSDRDSSARSALERARGILETAEGRAPVASFCDEVDAWLAERQGQTAKAESLNRRALAFAGGGEGRTEYWGTRISLARVLRKQHRLAEAEAEGVRAGELFETARQRAPLGIDRAGMVSRTGAPYRELAVIRLALGRGDAAWQAIERYHGRTLADMLAASGSPTLTPAEIAVRDSLRRRLDELADQSDRLAARADTSVEARELRGRVARQLQGAAADWSAFQRELAERHPEEGGAPPDLAGIRASLDPATALVGWLDLEDEDGQSQTWGYVLRSRGPVAWVRLDIDAAAAREEAGELRRELWNSRYFAGGGGRVAQQVWNARIEPLLPALRGVQRLVVVASGPLAGVPLEALRDRKGRLLGDRFAVSYTPSATVHAMLRRRGGNAPDARVALIVGDPVFSATPAPLAAASSAPGAGGSSAGEASPLRGIADSTLYRSALGGDPEALDRLPALPGTRAEVEAIAALADHPLLLTGAEATEERLEVLATSGELAKLGTIHIATHALADDERPLRSSLVLSRTSLPDLYSAALEGRRVFDGRVTAAEILREWRLQARLVTLSACQTGLGRRLGGEGIVGLSHAFIQSGAQSVLASLWPVDDQATSLMMRRFYQEWWGTERRAGSRGVSKAEALRRAKQWLRTQPGYDRPFYWAGFVLVGDPS